MYQEYLAEVSKMDTNKTIVVCLIFFVAIVLIGILVFLEMRSYYFEAGSLVALIFSLGLVLSFAVLIKYSANLDKVKNSYEEKAATEWVVVSKESLSSMNMMDGTTIEGSGNFFVSRLSGGSFTDYKYVVKTENGFQLRTVSKQYANLKENQIFIKEESSVVSPKIIYEKEQYTEEGFNKLFDKKNTRLTFVVPKGTVRTGFDSESIQ